MKKSTIRAVALTLVLTLIAALSASFVKVSAATTYVDTSAYESLAEVYKDYFKVGAACEAISHWNQSNKEIGNPHKEAVLSRIFNSITSGNELKPAYNFDKTSESLFKINRAGNEMLTWAKENGVAMRFHVLLWHSQVNPNFFAKDFKATSKGVPTNSDTAELDEECLVDRETLIERMRSYIYGAVEYIYANDFAQTIYAIDVVNEAVDESKDDGLRRSYWYRIIGPEFLYYAFLFAREAEVKYSKEYAASYGLDPNGDLSSILPKLYYNDYNEWFPARVSVVTDFVTNRPWNADQKMIASSVIKAGGNGTLAGDGLIDGIGMQGHLSDNNNVEQYIKAMRQYDAIVDEVQVTELDVKCTHRGENQWYYQAKFYYDLFKAMIDARKDGVNLTSVTVWGLTDDASWITDGYPLLFTYNLTAKPAYYGVLMAGKGEEFNMSVAEAITELKDINVDFEPYVDDMGVKTTYTAESAGFYKRGTGHMPSIRLMALINHTPDVKVGYSLFCERAEQDATCMLDISKFSGKNITFTSYVKTDDTEITIGLSTGEDTVLKTVKSNGDWTPLSINLDVPEKLSSAYIYFETNGNADMYIDDVSVIFTTDGEEAAPVITGAEEITPDDTDTQISDTDTDTADTENTSNTNTETTVTKTDSQSTDSKTSGIIIAIILIAFGSALTGYGIYLLASSKNKQ
ncbi:MAG: endo-1,4-beta-xylanase [Lachnospiraceae bacterium]|nr:endo-1,4-beta-xylanase [Lachnospiraceae bacterium]